MKLHHFGYLVKSIDKSLSELSKSLQIKKESKTYYDKKQDAFVKFLWYSDSINDECIELVQPGTNNTSLNKLLDKNGDHMYHLCYKIRDIDKKVSELVNTGAIIIQSKRPAIAFNNKYVVFLYIRSGLIFELLEE